MRSIVLLLVAVGSAACGRLDATGLGGDDFDAAPDDAVAEAIFESGSSDDSAPLPDVASDSTPEATAAVDSTVSDSSAADADADAGPPDAPFDAPAEVGVDAAVDADAGKPPFCDTTDTSLVACYRFENDVHPAQPFDESVFKNHGTATAATFVAGIAGRGVSIGPSTVLEVPESASLTIPKAITVEMWIYPRTIPLPAMTRAGLLDHDNRYGFFLLPAGALRVTSPSLDTAPGVVVPAKWQHVAFTYDGATLRVYVDGTQVASRVTSDNLGSGGGAKTMTIGSNSPSGQNFDGVIDSLRVFRAARTAKQICEAASKC